MGGIGPRGRWAATHLHLDLVEEHGLEDAVNRGVKGLFGALPVALGDMLGRNLGWDVARGALRSRGRLHRRLPPLQVLVAGLQLAVDLGSVALHRSLAKGL